MKKRNYLIRLLAVVLSLGVLVGCGDKANSSNEGASVNSSENSQATSSKDSADVAKESKERCYYLIDNYMNQHRWGKF